MHLFDRQSRLDKETLFNKGKQLGAEVRTFMPNKNMSERLSRVLKNFAFFDGASDVFAQLVKDQAFNDYIEKEKTDLVFGLCSYSWPVLKFATEKGIPSVFRSHNFEASFFWEEISFGKKFYPFNWLRVLAKYMEKKMQLFIQRPRPLAFRGHEVVSQMEKKKVSMNFP